MRVRCDDPLCALALHVGAGILFPTRSWQYRGNGDAKGLARRSLISQLAG